MDYAIGGYDYLPFWSGISAELTVAPVDPAYIVVTKVIVPSGDPGLFNLQIDGVTKATNRSNGGTTGPIEVTPGAHTVGETAGAGTDLDDYTTVYGGAASPSGVVIAVAGTTQTAIITNTKAAIPPGPGPCPDLEPDVLPPTPAPIPLECFHLVVAHPEDGIYVTLDFTNWLAPGDALQSATWTADAGVVITGQSATATAASLTANIPAAVDGEEYFLKCSVITQMGTTEVRRVQVEVRDADFGTHALSGWWRA